MKTLSIRNPYGYQIAYGIKDVENRTWKTNYRGRFLIHCTGLNMIDIMDEDYPEKFWRLCDKYWEFFDAGKKEETEKLCALNPCILRADDLDEIIEKYKRDQECYLKRGCIIGSVELIDIIKNSDSPFAEKGCYHWILENPILFDNPILDVKGRLNLWEYPGPLPEKV